MVASFNRPGSRIGDLAVLAGFLWFAPAWVGWEFGPTWVRSVGLIAAAFIFPVIAHLILAFPGERVRPLTARAVVAVGYIGAALSASGTALFWDPFFDPDCW